MNLLARLLGAVTVLGLTAGCSAVKSDTTAESTNTASIIGGTEVAEGSSLHQNIVGIFNKGRGTICTGSLLENNIVLTAAHCISKKPEDHIIIFATDLIALFKSEDRNFVLPRVRRSVKTVINPEWGKKHTKAEAWGDTALIKFQGPVPEGFAPAKMLAPNSLAEGTKVVVAGYGVDNSVMKEIDPAEHADFEEKLKGGEFFCYSSEDGKTKKCFQEEMSGEGLLRTTELQVAGTLNDTEIVLDQRYGKASCQGDSGGPAFVEVNGEYHLFGVTSRGSRGCNTYVVYSDVTTSKLAAWLETATVEVSK